MLLQVIKHNIRRDANISVRLCGSAKEVSRVAKNSIRSKGY